MGNVPALQTPAVDRSRIIRRSSIQAAYLTLRGDTLLLYCKGLADQKPR